MKTMRSTRGSGKIVSEKNEKRHYFQIMPILINLVTVAVLAFAYYYIVANRLFYANENYIYWAVNLIISYNILVASARSLWAPLLSIVVAALCTFAKSSSSLLFLSGLSSAQCIQLAALGIVGLLISFALR